MCDARLEDGSRVNIIGPPLALDGAAISIRRFRKGGFTVQELAKGGAMHPSMAILLEMATKAQLNVVVAGGTGAGKTTILNALSDNIHREERVVTLGGRRGVEPASAARGPPGDPGAVVGGRRRDIHARPAQKRAPDAPGPHYRGRGARPGGA